MLRRSAGHSCRLRLGKLWKFAFQNCRREVRRKKLFQRLEVVSSLSFHHRHSYSSRVESHLQHTLQSLELPLRSMGSIISPDKSSKRRRREASPDNDNLSYLIGSARKRECSLPFTCAVPPETHPKLYRGKRRKIYAITFSLGDR